MSKLDFFTQHNVCFQLVKLGKNKKLIGPNFKTAPYKPSCNDSEAVYASRMLEQTVTQKDIVSIKLNPTIMVIDVDLYEPSDTQYKGELEKEANDWIEKLKLTFPYSKSTSKPRGYHIYFTPSPHQLEFLQSKMRHADYPFKQIEILSGCLCYEDLTKKIYNGTKMSKLEIPGTQISPTVRAERDTPRCISKLTAKTADYEYSKWLKILTLLKSEGLGYKEIGREWSKKSKRYRTDIDYDKHWDYVNTKFAPRATFSKKEVTQNIYLDFYDIFKGNYIMNIIDGNPIYYIFDETTALWKMDTKKVLLQVKILNIMTKHYAELIETTNDMEIIDEIQKKLQKVQTINGGGVSDIAKLYVLKSKESFSSNIIFDDREDLFHFKEVDKTLDLNTLEFIERKKEHYATMIGCSLAIERKEESIAVWKTIIEDTFENHDERLNWLQIMCNSLSGKVLEKFLVQNGGGSNGKSLLNDIFRYLHNDYAFKGNVSILTKKLSDGGNPAIANMNKKRFCVFDEPSEQDTLEFSVIKAISGGSEISARKLYSNEDKCVMAGIKVLECNEKLKIDGDSGYSMIRRLIDLKYSATFMLESDKPTNWKALKIKTALPLYKTKDWLKNNISNFVFYLLDIMRQHHWNFLQMDNIKLCDSIRTRTDSYIDSSNDIYQTILIFCEYTGNEKDSLLLRTIHNRYTQSTEWNNLTKRQKRLLSCTKFKALVETNHKLKTFFTNKIAGYTQSGWITCYKFREDFIEEED